MANRLKQIRFGRDCCGDLEQAERREWLLTNGRGGYAAGNIATSLTRRYHGLLVAPLSGALAERHGRLKAEAVSPR
ncbi:MAG: glycogen debranching enzyme N-terminal domain-containing protein [Candidatus Thiodiazotropha sp. (ex Cardiolucina cf. quadrata)]|nr:glycogen debranching enzyme N-terminal domain-containing protein [Candidatus Thiodiazotropha sp. (ex Cardiolucina cf. quadrata)]